MTDTTMTDTGPILSVNNLNISFATQDGEVNAVNNLNFTLKRGETLGIVGESGSGKSQTVLSMMGLLAKNGRSEGEILFDGRDLLKLDAKALNAIRGNHISMVFQDPMTSLNPFLPISTQLTEVLTLHKGMTRAEAEKTAIDMLKAVKTPEAEKRLKMHPHEFSGGMRQRVMIAMALLCRPELLIADEPTTALDVTVQAQILTLLKDLQKELNTAIVMITHDLGVVAGLCDKVLVMYAGRTMEYGTVDQVFYDPKHPYTQGLLEALPRLDQEEDELRTIPGNPPNLSKLPRGCPFQERCSEVMDRCRQEMPDLETLSDGRLITCHLHGEKP